MIFDAFDEGIELGGLRNRNDIRLLVCYLLKTIDKPITEQQLNDAMLENGLANYFEIAQAKDALLKNGSIESFTENGEVYLRASERGREAAELLETNLPKTVREKAVNSAIRLLTIAQRERENHITVEKLASGGYNVTFSMGEGDEALMRLSVFVADSMQVDIVKKNFLDDPVKFYSTVITALTV